MKDLDEINDSEEELEVFGDEYEADDFIDDQFEDPDEERESDKPSKKRKKKHRRAKEERKYSVDQDDLELIGENLGTKIASTKLKRLKKNKVPAVAEPEVEEEPPEPNEEEQPEA